MLAGCGSSVAGHHLVHLGSEQWETVHQVQVRVGGDGVFVGDVEGGLGEDPAGVDAWVHQVHRGADPFGVTARPAPSSRRALRGSGA